jgi:hypothetical protein
MPVIEVFSRRGCHLCEIMIEALIPLIRDIAELQIHDIDSRDDWRDAYDVRVPIIKLNGTVLSEFTLDRGRVLAALAELADQG